MLNAVFRGHGAWGLGLLFIAGIVAGCSGKGNQPDLTPVAGIVTLDGQPLADADLTFYLQGQSVPGYTGSTGKTDAAGKYQLISGSRPGAVPGDFKVTISRLVSESGAAVTLEEGMDMMQLEMQGLAKQSLSENYWNLDQSELSVKVEKGKADGYDFPLSGS